MSREIGRGLIKHVLKISRDEGPVRATLTTFRDVRWNEQFYRSMGLRDVDLSKPANARLTDIVAAEIRSGLPQNRRVGMAYVF